MYVSVDVNVDDVLDQISTQELLDEISSRPNQSFPLESDIKFSESDYETLRELIKYRTTADVMDFLDKKLFPR